MSMGIDFIILRGILGCRFRSLGMSKMKFVAVIANDWKPYDEIYYIVL